jgi:hypothetical protein
MKEQQKTRALRGFFVTSNAIDQRRDTDLIVTERCVVEINPDSSETERVTT